MLKRILALKENTASPGSNESSASDQNSRSAGTGGASSGIHNLAGHERLENLEKRLSELERQQAQRHQETLALLQKLVQE